MNKLQLMAVVIAMAAACGGKKDELETVALGTSGFVVDIPKGWTVEVPMDGFFEFKGGRGAPQVMESSVPVGDVDAVVKSFCDGRPDVQKGTLPDGLWVACKGESQMIKGVQTTQIVVKVKIDDKKSFDCHLETDQDPAFALGICKSIRKKA